MTGPLPTTSILKGGPFTIVPVSVPPQVVLNGSNGLFTFIPMPISTVR